MQSPTQTPPTPARKAVLFCPECGHESPVDGDWLVREDDDVRAYECPECGTFIEVRPVLADADESQAAGPGTDGLAEAGRLWLDLWTDWVRAWTPSARRGSG